MRHWTGWQCFRQIACHRPSLPPQPRPASILQARCHHPYHVVTPISTERAGLVAMVCSMIMTRYQGTPMWITLSSSTSLAQHPQDGPQPTSTAWCTGQHPLLQHRHCLLGLPQLTTAMQLHQWLCPSWALGPGRWLYPGSSS